MKRLTILTLFLLLILGLTACGNQATETPTAQTRVAAATNTPADPTATTEPTATPTIEPPATATAETIPSPSAEPTAEPTATTPSEPTNTPEPVNVPLTISQPVAGSDVAVESDLTVSGQVSPAAAALVNITLQAGPTALVTGTAQVDPSSGAWLTTLAVPPFVTGNARVIASTEAENAMVDINLLPSNAPGGTILRLARPAVGDTLVSGRAAFFEGTALEVINETITIAILGDNCGTVAAAQSFTVNGGEWRGFIILPQDLSGPACAVVYTGTPGTAEWRQTQVSVVLLTPDEAGASRIELGNPAFETYTAGETITLFGLAVNAPDNEIQLTASMGGTVILPATAVAVDDFGYWEIELTLPAGSSGSMTITASMGGEGEMITAEWVVDVDG